MSEHKRGFLFRHVQWRNTHLFSGKSNSQSIRQYSAATREETSGKAMQTTTRESGTVDQHALIRLLYIGWGEDKGELCECCICRASHEKDGTCVHMWGWKKMWRAANPGHSSSSVRR